MTTNSLKGKYIEFAQNNNKNYISTLVSPHQKILQSQNIENSFNNINTITRSSGFKTKQNHTIIKENKIQKMKVYNQDMKGSYNALVNMGDHLSTKNSKLMNSSTNIFLNSLNKVNNVNSNMISTLSNNKSVGNIFKNSAETLDPRTTSLSNLKHKKINSLEMNNIYPINVSTIKTIPISTTKNKTNYEEGTGIRINKSGSFIGSQINFLSPKNPIQQTELTALPSFQLLYDNSNYFKYSSCDTAKCSTRSSGKITTFSVNTHNGNVRTYNEDRVSIILNVLNPENHQNWPHVSFFAIYDGHAGVRCADYMKENLHQFVKFYSFYRYLEKNVY
jgi:hypothetical protein